jgi:RNA polymerase sigma factor (sigma-70 family)
MDLVCRPLRRSMRSDRFPNTSWTVVLKAGEDFGQQSKDALAILCKAYWYPLYAFVRRRGHSPEQAQDLTQGFFARLLEKHYVRDCRRERGRFRSFLLVSLKHFLANEWDRAQAQRRGSGETPVSLDAVVKRGEHRYSLEPRDDLTPEKIFEKEWALTLLEKTLCALEGEFEQAGKKDHFAHLKDFLTGPDARIPYSQLASGVGMSEGALRVTIHRLRARFREVLRQEISQTVSDPSEAGDEIRYLKSVLAR